MVVWRCSAMMMIGAPEATAHAVKGVSYGVAETLKQQSIDQQRLHRRPECAQLAPPPAMHRSKEWL